MAFFNEFPHTRNYDSDLGWLIKWASETLEKINSFTDFQAETSGDIITMRKQLDRIIEALTEPITEWNPESTYPIYSMVKYLDHTYIAIQNVPSGIGPLDTNYWMPSEGLETVLAAIEIKIAELEEALSSVPSTSCVSPVYLGDWIERQGVTPSCIYKSGNLVYAIIANNNTQNNGTLKIFDTELNRMTGSKTIKCGHANGMAYDSVDNKFYIAALYDYSTGEAVECNYVWVYDPNWTTYTQLATPTYVQGISFDPVTETLYYYNKQGGIYKYDRFDRKFKLYKNLTVPMAGYVQDLAVYDGIMYIATPRGSVLQADLTTETYNTWCVLHTDVNVLYSFGELEGWEFTPDGHLIAMMYTGVTSLNWVFAVEIPVGSAKLYPYDLAIYFNRAIFTYTLTPDTIAEFKRANDHIKSLNCLRALFQQPSMVTVRGNVTEPGEVRISQDLKISLTEAATNYSIDKLSIDNGKVALSGPGTLILRSSSDGPIETTRSGYLHFTTSNILRISTPNNSSGVLVEVGTAWNPLIVRKVPTSVQGYTFKMSGGTELKDTSVYYGGTRMLTTNDIDRGLASITIPANENYVDVVVPFNHEFSSAPAVTITPLSNTTNKANVGFAVLTQVSATQFTVRFWRFGTATTLPQTTFGCRWIATNI